MSESINAEFEAYVKAELGDIAVVSEGRFISPKIQNYFKIWQHLKAEVDAALDCSGKKFLIDEAIDAAIKGEQAA